MIDETIKGYNFRLAGTLYEAGSAYNQSDQSYKMVLRKSTNDGVSWTQYLLDERVSCAYAVLPHPTNNNIIYIGGDVTKADGYNYPILYQTTDNGATWRSLGENTFTQSWEKIQILLCDQNNPNRMIAGTNYAFFLSTNGGASWSKTLSNVDVSSAVIDPQNGNTIYLGTRYSGVKLSTNGGASWTDYNDNLPSLDVESMDYDNVNKVLYIGTRISGVYRRIVGTAVAVEQESMPGRFELAQNYPNPFNPTTDIEFRTANFEFVTLKVFDVLGREIATLAEGYHSAGSYKATFDASGLSSGVYYYRLEARQTDGGQPGGASTGSARSFVQTKAMVLMK